MRPRAKRRRGEGWGMRRSRFEERWAEPLARVARFFAGSREHSGLAARILGEHDFGRSRTGPAFNKASVFFMPWRRSKLV